MPGILHSILELIITSLRRMEGEIGKEGKKRRAREGGREGGMDGTETGGPRRNSTPADDLDLWHVLLNTHLLKSLLLLHSSFGSDPVVDIHGQLWNPQQLH